MSKDKEQPDKEQAGQVAEPKAGKEAKAGKAPKPAKGESKPAKDEAKSAKEKPSGPPPSPRLRERYHKEILPRLAEQFGRTNRLNLPRLQKITVNMGVGSAATEKKHLEDAVSALSQITGQKPVTTKARRSVASFKLREGQAIGCKVTLRGYRMWEFLDRLVSLALPRVRDFRGLNPDAFDGRGNYNLGLTEQLVFPELNPDKFTRPQGMNVTLNISGGSDDESRELLRQLGLPFKTETRAAGAA